MQLTIKIKSSGTQKKYFEREREREEERDFKASWYLKIVYFLLDIKDFSQGHYAC